VNSEAIVLVKKGEAKHAFVRQDVILPALKKGEVIIKSEAFGLNYADVMARNGLYREAPPMPCVIGYEVVGEVVSVGPEGNSDLIGKRVLAFCRFGGYGRHVITTELALVSILDLPSSEVLALSTQGVTAYYMTDYLAPIKKGERVLIHAAAGGVGTLLIQLAKLRGAEVIAKVGSAEKEEVVKKLGADLVINYKTQDYIEGISDQAKLDVSFNPVGGSTFKKDWNYLRPGGKLYLFGGAELSGGRFGILSSLNFLRKMGVIIPAALMMTSKSILGVNMLKIADEKPAVMQDCLAQLMELYLQKKIKVIVGKTYNVKDISEAHAYLESGTSVGKISIVWD
jgi:NADPH2:quinone reductase